MGAITVLVLGSGFLHIVSSSSEICPQTRIKVISELNSGCIRKIVLATKYSIPKSAFASVLWGKKKLQKTCVSCFLKEKTVICEQCEY